MTTNFTVTQIGGYNADVDDILMRREYFSDGTLFTWGSNSQGQLGSGAAITVSRSSPGTTAGGGINWKQVACGYSFGAAIKTDGTLWTWGANASGQLGDNSAVSKLSPVTTAGGGTNWKQTACGYFHTAAIKTDGTLWTWGSNNRGQLGANLATNVSRSSPATTAGAGANWRQVAACTYATFAIKTDGTLWAWGNNNGGQLGDNTIVNKSSPVTTAGGGTNWKQVACAYNHTTAIKTDGTLWTWGGNAFGQLGDNTTTPRSSPATTAGAGTDWKQVACGSFYTAAVKTDGTLWTWGGNSSGQLGANLTTTVSRSSPGTTAGGGTNWKQVACGYRTASAVKADGTLWTWGRNDLGQLGDSTQTDRSSPGLTAGGGTNWKQNSAGGKFVAATTDLTV